MSTPHIGAEKGDIAKVVLMPGDPLRAEYIAKNYLSNAVCYNTVRNMLGFTGEYNGVKISVQGSGMGMPSIGIYSYELYNFYGVESIIRVGTAGGVAEKVKLRDIVIGAGACTNSNYAMQYKLPGTFAPTADFELLSAAAKAAKEVTDKAGVNYHVGNIFSSDTFYDAANSLGAWAKMGVLGVEMEAAALYMNAAAAGKKALCICTISDLPLTGESTTAAERQTGFTNMMEIGLRTAVQFG